MLADLDSWKAPITRADRRGGRHYPKPTQQEPTPIGNGSANDPCAEPGGLTRLAFASHSAPLDGLRVMSAITLLQETLSLPTAPTEPTLSLSRRRVHLQSGTITYVDEGRGRPIVLLHGAPTTSLGFVRVIRPLALHYRVLAPDLPGFGGSEPGATFSGTLAAYAQMVEEFCRALDLQGIVVYLNDSSGAFGLVAAARLRTRVAGLVVADTVPVPLTGLAWPVKLALRHVVSSWPVRAVNRRWNVLPWLVATVAPWRRPFTPAERAVLQSQFDTAQKRDRVVDLFAHMGWDDAFMRTAAQAAAALADTPALILYGQFDPMRLVGGVRRYRRLFRRHQVVIVPGEEHFPILAEGERVAAAIHDWLCTVR